MPSQALMQAELSLLSTAAAYDLSKRSERKRSADDLAALFRHVTRALQPEATLEIGARQADYSIWATRKLPDARVFAFEANPHNVASFGPRCLEAGVDYRHAAVSETDGVIDFKLQLTRDGNDVPPTAGNNSLLTRESGDIRYETVSVASTRIDTILAAESVTGCLTAWIDVEGALHKVLPGWGGAVSQLQAALVEVEHIAYWSDQWLWPQVFDWFSDHGLAPVARDFEYGTQNNILLIRPEVWGRVQWAIAAWRGQIARRREIPPQAM